MITRHLRAAATSLGIIAGLGAGVASAADGIDVDLGAVGIGGGPATAATAATPAAAAPPATTPPAPVLALAPALAPTTAPLAATQPTSQVGAAYIATALPASSSYDEIVRIVPSVVSIAPNGPGLGEAADVTIRGFADGQYNVTFDGIPFADADDFSHHSTAYFMAHALRGVSVDRGPGTASTIGDASFGGTVALQSRNPAAAAGGSVYTSLGSFGTRLFGGQVDTGAIAALNGGAYTLNVEHLQSDGYLTSSGQERLGAFFKGVQPVGDSTVVTIVANTQNTQQFVPAGATRAQIAANGPNFALTSDPTNQNFYRYNAETYRTDFEYINIRSQVTPSTTVDDTAYTYALFRHFRNGEDVNGETPNGTAFGPNNVPGQFARNDLRAFGDILRVNQDTAFGTLHTGIWVEHQTNQRGQDEVDLTLGGFPNPVLSPVPGVPNSAFIDREQHETLTTVQPFVEFEWKPIPALTITPGVKFALFDRNVNASVMEGTRLTTVTDATYRSALPALSAHYQITAGWAAYAQFAKGFLAPQLQFLDVPDPKANPVAPEQTWNLQIGSTYQGERFSLSADAYYVDFINMVGSRMVGADTQVFNEGGVTLLGLESEATVKLGAGFSLYGNGSLNSARQRSTNTPVPNTPQATLAGGVLYDHDGWFGSVIDKWVGARYGDTGRQQGLAPFNQLDMSVGWKIPPAVKHAPPLELRLTAQNLLDSRKIVALAGYTAAANTPLYFTQAGRSLFFGATAYF